MGFVKNAKIFITVGLLALVAFASVLRATITQDSDQQSIPEPSSYVPEGYNFVFGDEFEGVGLNESRWEYRYQHLAYYGAGVLSEKSVAQPGDGFLHLATIFENGQFLTGMIRSVDEFQYGYFEARIQFQQLQGHHGAFWLQSPLYGQFIDDPAKSGAEIDIIEFFGSGRSGTDAQQNVYWNEYASPNLQERINDVFYRDRFGQELSHDFHLFSLLWTPDEYVFFIDGVETWRLREGISQVPEYLVLSLTTSEWENQLLDIDALPDEMLIDYLRVYQTKI